MSSDQEQAAAPKRRNPAHLVEKLWPTTGVWLALFAFGAAFGLIPGPINTTFAIATGIFMAFAVLALAAVLTPRLELAKGVFSAGRAQVPVSLVATVEPLDAAEMKTALGAGLNARAFRCTRAWVSTGVRITLDDPQDPTPYWLLSTRRPQEWVRALGS